MSEESLPNSNESILVNGILFKHENIFRVIDDFYHRVQKDEHLKIPFQSVHDWPEHIKRLTHFWWIRFGGKAYMFTEYNPVAKHYFAGFNAFLLERWLKLFHQTLMDHLNSDQIKLWKVITERMGQSLTIKNEYLNEMYKRESE